MEGTGGIGAGGRKEKDKRERKKEREILEVCIWIEDPCSNLGPDKWS